MVRSRVRPGQRRRRVVHPGQRSADVDAGLAPHGVFPVKLCAGRAPHLRESCIADRPGWCVPGSTGTTPQARGSSGTTQRGRRCGACPAWGFPGEACAGRAPHLRGSCICGQAGMVRPRVRPGQCRRRVVHPGQRSADVDAGLAPHAAFPVRLCAGRAPHLRGSCIGGQVRMACSRDRPAHRRRRVVHPGRRSADVDAGLAPHAVVPVKPVRGEPRTYGNRAFAGRPGWRVPGFGRDNAAGA